MPISVRLKPELESHRKSRSALIHDALTVFLKPPRAPLGAAISAALAEAPDGFGIERKQPKVADKRKWGR